MKKLAVAVVLVAAIASLYMTRRNHYFSAADTPVTDDNAVEGLGNSPGPNTGAYKQFHGPRLSGEMLRQASKTEAPKTPPLVQVERDNAYDRLLLRQGRDPVKEQQLLSRLVDLYRDRPEASVGEVACSSEFCRVDLRVNGRVDGRTFWAKDDAFRAAVDPKGLTIFQEGGVTDDNTTATCYFGRNDSWTVPDFHSLGIL